MRTLFSSRVVSIAVAGVLISSLGIMQLSAFATIACTNENSLLADAGVIGLGGTLDLTQKIDTCNGLTGEIKSWIVLDADGDTCVADGLPATISFTGTETREFPTDFSIAIAGGDGACDTGDVGIYNSETQVAINGVVKGFSEEFETNFFVIPESPIGVAALMGSALAALGGFIFLRNRSNGKNGMVGAGPRTA